MSNICDDLSIVFQTVHLRYKHLSEKMIFLGIFSRKRYKFNMEICTKTTKNVNLINNTLG